MLSAMGAMGGSSFAGGRQRADLEKDALPPTRHKPRDPSNPVVVLVISTGKRSTGGQPPQGRTRHLAVRPEWSSAMISKRRPGSTGTARLRRRRTQVQTRSENVPRGTRERTV